MTCICPKARPACRPPASATARAWAARSAGGSVFQNDADGPGKVVREAPMPRPDPPA